MNRNPVHRWPLLLTGSLTIGLCLLFLWSLQCYAQAAPSSSASGRALLVSSLEHETTIDPLPGGCIGNTPAGSDALVCCISGFVFLNGQKISNAQVTIVDKVGTLTQAPTEVHDSANGPYYRINLAGLTRPITPTDVITIYATYGSLSSAPVRHTVQRDGQQVNLLLYDPNPNALALAGQTQGQG